MHNDIGTCVRIRVEGKTQYQIKLACENLDIHLQKIYPKNNISNGYRYYGYGNSKDKFPGLPPKPKIEKPEEDKARRERSDKYADECVREYSNEDYEDPCNDAFPFGLIDH